MEPLRRADAGGGVRAAARGEDLPAVASVMLAFGLGAATPLLLVSTLSRTALLRWRGRMAQAGQTGKVLLGAGAVAVALLVLTGLGPPR